MMKDIIPLSVPYLGEEEARAAGEAVASGWVTQGPRVKAFEDAFAEYTGAPFACAVSSCTAALHLALLSAGVSPGDVVATVSHSFIATANAVRYCQAEPVFVDIDPATRNMDPAALARSINGDFEERNGSLWYKHVARIAVGESPLRGRSGASGRLAAILVVHQVGLPADLSAILAIADHFNTPVIEDAACAIGSEIRIGDDWEKIGQPHGDVACFSFHPRKVITTGDGGMLATNNPEYDRRFRLLRHHGMSVSDAARHRSDKVVFEDYPITAYNYRMTDIQAAVGIEQMKRLPEIVHKRGLIASKYMDALAGLPGLQLPAVPPFARTNWQSFIVRLIGSRGRDSVIEAMQNSGISTRRGVMCSHLEPPYAKGWPRGSLPASEAGREFDIILPLFPAMTDPQVQAVATALAAAVGSSHFPKSSRIR